jgi:hypothetical protein
MDWKDISGLVGKAAPVLGTLLGGPAGGAIGGITPANVDQVLAAGATRVAVAGAVVGAKHGAQHSAGSWRRRDSRRRVAASALADWQRRV